MSEKRERSFSLGFRKEKKDKKDKEKPKEEKDKNKDESTPSLLQTLAQTFQRKLRIGSKHEKTQQIPFDYEALKWWFATSGPPPDWKLCPKDVLQEIFSHLSIHILAVSNRTCKKWFEAYNEEGLWQRLCKRDWRYAAHLPKGISTWKTLYMDLYQYRIVIISGEISDGKKKLEDVFKKVTSAGGLSPRQVKLINLRSSDCTLDKVKKEVKGANAILFWSNQNTFGPISSDDMGNILSDYVECGGGVVIGVFTTAGFPLKGKWLETDKDPITPKSQGELKSIGIEFKTKNHPIAKNVNTWKCGTCGYYSTGTLAPGAQLIATYEGTNIPAIVEHKEYKVLALNIYPPSSDARNDFWDATTDGAKLLVNSLKYIAGHYTNSDMDVDDFEFVTPEDELHEENNDSPS